MKKVLALVMICALLLSCVVLTACSGSSGATSTSTPASTPAEAAASSVKNTPVSPATTPATAPAIASLSAGLGSEKIWLDVPIYSGAKITFSQFITKQTGQYSKEERRTYQTADDMVKVSAFYKSGMPDNGWAEISWKEDKGEINAQFDKNSKKDFVSINISAEKGQTYIIFVRDIQ